MRPRPYTPTMDITVGAVGRASLSDWEQECCGDPIAVGEVHELIVLPSRGMSQAGPLASAGWVVTYHDDGSPAGSIPLRRVRAVVRAAHEVWPSGRLAEIDRVPGHADLTILEPEEATGLGLGEVVYVGACEPVLPETPRPDEWLLDLEILEDLGPHTW